MYSVRRPVVDFHDHFTQPVFQLHIVQFAGDQLTVKTKLSVSFLPVSGVGADMTPALYSNREPCQISMESCEVFSTGRTNRLNKGTKSGYYRPSSLRSSSSVTKTT